MGLKKVCVCGHFGFGKDLTNGQTIKTKIVTQELEHFFGQDQILKIDTHGGIKVLVRLPFLLIKGVCICQNVIILPAQNGLQIIAPILFVLRSFFSKSKLHYIVIGGWLASFLKDKPTLKKILMKFDAIYVETNTMCNELLKLGFNNIMLLENCKNLDIVKQEDIVKHFTEPYKLCTFSRVMQEKGIEDAIEAVKAVNQRNQRITCTLDIYGPVDSEQYQWFEELKSDFPEYIHYGGVVPYEKSVEVLKSYFALLFPTRFFTEGVPGTIIDAYAAGVPVISSRWESFGDIVDDGYSGLGYTFSNRDELVSCLTYAIDNPDSISRMKLYCLKKAEQYSSETVMKKLMMQM